MENCKRGELWKTLQNEELEEGDVWEVLRDKHDNNNNISGHEERRNGTVSGTSKSIQIARTNSRNGQSSGMQQSAPVKVPDWSKMNRGKEPPKSSRSVLPDFKGGEINDDDEKLPPHEIVARRLARRHILTFSVMEGAGRTLKGRDLSTVREAVLRKTGFIELPTS